MSDVIIAVPASKARLGAGAVLQAALGALLVWIAFAHPPAAFGWRLMLLAFGTVALWSAVASWRVRDVVVELTEEELRDSRGTTICRIDDIRRVSRGPFAFKPSRGFALLLRDGERGAWVPGIWWRVGRRVGVGGSTSAAATRMMAETIEAMLASRNRAPGG